MNEENEKKLDLNEIERDLIQGLKNANENENPTGSIGSNDSIHNESGFVVPDYAVKLFCDIKNNIELKYLTHDLDEDIKEAVRNILRTTDKETKVYKLILEMVGGKYLPEDHKKWVGEILNSPILLLIELEMEKMILAMKEIRILVKQKEKKATA